MIGLVKVGLMLMVVGSFIIMPLLLVKKASIITSEKALEYFEYVLAIGTILLSIGAVLFVLWANISIISYLFKCILSIGLRG